MPPQPFYDLVSLDALAAHLDATLRRKQAGLRQRHCKKFGGEATTGLDVTY